MYLLGITSCNCGKLSCGVVSSNDGKASLIATANTIENAVAAAGITLADIEAAGITGATDKINTDGIKKVVKVKTADAEAIGESVLGYDSDTYSLIRIDIGDTVDCGLLINGKIYEGFDGAGAEIAHMTVDFGGRDCSCGKKGCFEAYVSLPGLRQTAEKYGVKCTTCLTDIFSIGTESAKAASAEFVGMLACGLTNMINLFQPDALILGGAITKAGDALMKPLSEIIARDQYARHSPKKTEIKYTGCKYAAVVGAALSAK